MKLKSTFSKLLTNKLLLNIIAVISLFNILGYLMVHNLNAAVYFIALAFLIFYFSKNMIIVLGVPLILVNLFVYMNIVKEGMETATSTKSEPLVEDKLKKSENSNNMKSNQKHEKATPQGLPRTNIDSETSLNSSIDASEHKFTSGPTDETFEVGRQKGGSNYKIDYASTVEDAYAELNKVIGGEGIKKLTGDTQRLMQQQLDLADAMKSMGPLIKGMAPLMQQAQGLLSGMGDKEGGLGNIMEMAKKFSGNQA
jgi:Tfp pilus assembly major pilin PilA